MNKPVRKSKQLVGIKYEILPLKILKETPGNPQKMSEQEFNGIVKSMKERGWILDAPVCWKRPDGEYQIISGHHRIMAGIKAGIVETGCKVVEGITEEQARIFVLEANQRKGKFEELMFNDFVDDIINEFNIDKEILFDEIGLYEDILQEILDIDAEPQFDISEKLLEKYKIKNGQVWLLGDHKIICGDSKDPETFKKLLGDERYCLVFTDPPYGVAIGDKNKFLNLFQKSKRNLKNIKSDNETPGQLKDTLFPIFNNIKTFASENCTFFVTSPQGGGLSMMMMMMKEALYEVRHVLIWKKNSPTFSMGRLDYDYQHEPILLTWGKRHKSIMAGKHRTSVWEIDKPRANKEHPTMKPVELYDNAILNNSEPGDICLDAFSGSGTMIISCERTGRKARVIEIDPGYVAVAIQRWVDVTQKEPILLKQK